MQMKNTYTDFVGKHEGEGHLVDIKEYGGFERNGEWSEFTWLRIRFVGELI
jgi:hypothetical protein